MSFGHTNGKLESYIVACLLRSYSYFCQVVHLQLKQ